MTCANPRNLATSLVRPGAPSRESRSFGLDPRRGATDPTSTLLPPSWT